MFLKKRGGREFKSPLPPPREKTCDERDYLIKALDCLEEGVALLDHSGKILQTNSLFSFLLPAPEPQGRNIREILRKPEFVAALTKEEETRVYLDPSWTGRGHLEVRLIPLAERKVLLLKDVTRIRQMEVSQRDFIANVSHELKTPLTAIAGYAETILEESQDEIISHSARVILKHSERLTKLIRNLLTLSSLKGHLLEEKILLEAVVLQSLEAVTSLAREKQIKLAFKGKGQVFLRGKEDLLVQALINILENAIKFSPPGSNVKLTTETEGPWVKITIADQGPGIPEEAKERIFERFYQAGRDRRQGAGLGLAITKEIVTVHGGRIWAENLPSGGAAFHIILPTAP